MVVYNVVAQVTLDRNTPYFIGVTFPFTSGRIQISSVEVQWMAWMYNYPAGQYVDSNVRLTMITPKTSADVDSFQSTIQSNNTLGWLSKFMNGDTLIDECGYVCGTTNWLTNAPTKWYGRQKVEPFKYYDTAGSRQSPTLVITSDLPPTSTVGFQISFTLIYQVITLYGESSYVPTLMRMRDVVRGDTYEEDPFSDMDVGSFYTPKQPKPLIAMVPQTGASRKTTTSLILE